MVGDKLRAERERRNLTIKDIEQGTSIRSLYIENIEAGKFDQMPGEVYTKGFIRSYANFLQLDATKLVRDYMEENHPEKAAQDAALGAPTPVTPHNTQPERVSVRHEPTPMTSDLRQRVDRSHHRQNLLVVGVVAVIALVAGAFFFFENATPSADQMRQASKSQAAQPAKNSAQKQEAASGSASQKKYDGVEVTAKFTDRCWTEAKVDGKVVYEGTAEKGSTMNWKGQKRVIVTAGNAGAVRFTVNGKDMGKTGDFGEVVEKTFTKDDD